MRPKNSGKVFLRFKFVFMMRKHLCPIGLFLDGVSGENASGSQSALDVGHQVGDFSFCEMLDRCVPNNIVEDPLWHLCSNISKSIDDIVSGEMFFGVRDGLGIEIDRNY
jgi:hypothetical protein